MMDAPYEIYTLRIKQAKSCEKEQRGMKFTKCFKTPDPVPAEGISRAVELMKTGRLYRYNFDGEFTEDTDTRVGSSELAREVALLESEFCEYTGHKYAVAVNSCGSALFLALKAAGVQYSDKVLTNAFTFTAVPSSIVHAGGVPVYVECDREYLLDIEDLKRKIIENPDAKYLMLSHMRGQISDVEAIAQICSDAGIYLIEDCAHSLGATWYDRQLGEDKIVGHDGKIACFSSQSYKLINSGEGGLVATSDERVAAYCILAAGSYEQLYKKHSSRPFDDELFEELKPHVPNFSLRMNNLTAAVIRSQIPTLPDKIAECNKKYSQLENILAVADNIYIPSPLKGVKRAPDSIQFTLLNLTKEQIDKLVKRTAQRGVKIKIFGRQDNARYFKNWQYSFVEMPDLQQTDEIISCACDLRISLSFTREDINLMGYIVKDTLYKIIAEENRVDYRQGLTTSFKDINEVVSKYDNWVSDYDREHHNNGWKIMLNHLVYTLTSYLQSTDKILDVGCGTGLFGKELNSYNFSNLHGIDISEKYLQVAQELKIYKGLERAELGKRIDFADKEFDALVSCGVFTRNQVPLNAFSELIRILKPQGLLAMNLMVEDNDYYYNKLKEYYDEGILAEVEKTRIQVLKSCSHDLVIVRKLG